MKHNRLWIIGLLALMTSFVSCDDTLDYGTGNVAEGESEVHIDASFRNFTPALTTRTAGDAIQSIDRLLLFIYNTDGTPYYVDVDGTQKFPLTYSSTALTEETHGEESDDRVSFNLKLPNGQYRMYALANMSIDKELDRLKDGEYLTEERLLKATTPKWDAENVANNNEMFGRFDSNIEGGDTDETVGDDGEEELKLAPTVVVNGRTNLHVWLRRCASKLTLQYNGEQLYDGVYIYLMSATIKDIPTTCALGVQNKVTYSEALISDGEAIDYYTGGRKDPNGLDLPPTANDILNPTSGIVITNGNTEANNPSEFKKRVWPQTEDENGNPIAHSNTANALFFYENMQGEGKSKLQDADGDHQLDIPGKNTDPNDPGYKDKMPFGTYVEVEAIYYADTNLPDGSKYQSTGVIKYRFMLGKNITTDYNAERNYHYKLTLNFKNKGNDVDWHIDYADQVLDVTQPKVFDYQGRVFVPDGSVPNFDHNFTNDNTVKLTSYMTDGMDEMYPYTVYYKEPGDKDYRTTKPNWFDMEITNAINPYDKNVTFRVKDEYIVCDKFGISSLFNTQKGESWDKPFNLANPEQGAVAPANATIKNTANCYMIDAPGFYLIPLVYGNAIEDGQDNKKAYQPNTSGDDVLATFEDYLGNPITSPYICNSGTPKSGMLMWQDAQNLIEYNIWGGDDNSLIKYKADAYGKDPKTNKSIGGLVFHVQSGQEGNAVIAVSDMGIKNGAQCWWEGDGSVALPRAMWSWHIWVTSFRHYDENDKFDKGINEEDRTIRVLGNDQKLTYDLMPVNLGWCSEGEEITYYPGRECLVKFVAGAKEKEINVVQKSHIALPRGNCTYYQWGRKDPFIGAVEKSTGDHDNARWEWNKLLSYTNNDAGTHNNIPRFTRDLIKDDATETVDGLAAMRKTTVELLHEMIQQPYRWHNPPRNGLNPGPYSSNDKTYFNLWDGDNGYDKDVAPLKTIYDPCPVGYQVPNYRAFSGFAYQGLDASDSDRWFDVREDHIKDYDKSTKTWVTNETYRDQVYEFYTTHEKYQSIVFPQIGYRDWDAFAYIYKIGKDKSIGYAWSAHIVDGNNHNMAYNFEFTRYDSSTPFVNGKQLDTKYVRPQNPYFPCDGFPVRACKQPTNADRKQNGQ